MDSATGKLVRQEDKDGLIVGESYLHQPEESFKIGDVTYTYNQENAKNKLQIENLSGHPGKDEIVIYYKASAPDSNQNSDHDSKPNPPKVKKPVAPKKLQAVRTGTTKAKITFKKVKKADGYQISYADNKKFRKAKKLSTGKTTVILTFNVRKTVGAEDKTISLKAGAAGKVEFTEIEATEDVNSQIDYGNMPHRKAVMDADIQEGRRLFYVGMTRAKDKLYLYYAKERYGQELSCSRFIEELRGDGTPKPGQGEKRRQTI